MPSNPLRRLQELGQSVWLDFISRPILASGELQRLIEQDGVSGVTSNPKMFSEAIGGSRDYDEDIARAARNGKSPRLIYQELAVEDVRRAAGLLEPLYERTGGAEGYVSLEVSPELAYDANGTMREARALWRCLDRPNVLVKIPGTRACLRAIRRMISEGLNINVTLLFSLDRYCEVAEAYITGLEERVQAGQAVDAIHSIASFFVSRIDALVDPLLAAAVGRGGAAAERARGRVAIACARLAYQAWKEIFGGERFRRLARQGARPQRLLWASTSTKDPARGDLAYVEPLIGPGTVTTMPPATLAAYRDHGSPAARLEEEVAQAREVIESLPEAGIDLDRVTAELEQDGVRKFREPFDALLAGLEQKRRAFAAGSSVLMRTAASGLP
jgi:transaldolase